MHAATPAPATAGGFGIQFSHEMTRIEALGECVSMAPMRAGDPVVGAQMCAYACRDGFFTDVEVTETGEFACLVEPLNVELELTQEDHLLVEVQQGCLVRRSGRLAALGGSGWSASSGRACHRLLKRISCVWDRV